MTVGLILSRTLVDQPGAFWPPYQLSVETYTMSLHDDPITALALTPRRQQVALEALPWGEDEERWQRHIGLSVTVVALILFASFVFSR